MIAAYSGAGGYSTPAWGRIGCTPGTAAVVHIGWWGWMVREISTEVMRV